MQLGQIRQSGALTRLGMCFFKIIDQTGDNIFLSHYACFQGEIRIPFHFLNSLRLFREVLLPLHDMTRLFTELPVIQDNASPHLASRMMEENGERSFTPTSLIEKELWLMKKSVIFKMLSRVALGHFRYSAIPGRKIQTVYIRLQIFTIRSRTSCGGA